DELPEPSCHSCRGACGSRSEAAAVQANRLTGDPARLIRGEVHAGVADVDASAEAADRDPLLGTARDRPVSFASRCGPLHHAERQGVRGDAAPPTLDRQVSHEADAATLAGCVDGDTDPEARLAGPGRDRDDPTETALAHAVDRGLDTVEDS